MKFGDEIKMEMFPVISDQSILNAQGYNIPYWKLSNGLERMTCVHYKVMY